MSSAPTRCWSPRGQPHRPYNVCSGTAHRIGDLLDALIAMAHVRVSIELDPARMRPSDNPVVLGDPHARRSRTSAGRPRIPIEQTLARPARRLPAPSRPAARRMTAADGSERARKVVHVAMGGFALLLRFLPWWQAALLAGDRPGLQPSSRCRASAARRLYRAGGARARLLRRHAALPARRSCS